MCSEAQQQFKQQVAKETTNLFLVEYVVFSDNVLNLVDCIVWLGFCEETLPFEQGNFEGTWTTVVLMQNLQIVATSTRKMLLFRIQEK